MDKKEKGILIYSEWFNAMVTLSAKDFKALMMSIYNYQIHDLPPEEFVGKAQVLASVIFPCIERRKKQAERGRLGGLAKAARQNESEECDSTSPAPPRHSEEKNGSSAVSSANSGANSSANNDADNSACSGAISGAIDQSIVENSKVKNSIEEYSVAEYSQDHAERYDADGTRRNDALAHNEKEGEAVGFGYGIYGNVYLCTEEYLSIKREIPDADRYIDQFSRKLHDRGYRYSNHASAILEWWRRDREYEKRRENGEQVKYASEPPGGSFDTDSFFEAAVRRSLGEDALL